MVTPFSLVIPPPEVVIDHPPEGSVITTNRLTSVSADPLAPLEPARTVGGAQTRSALGSCSNAREVGSRMHYPARAQRLGLSSGSATVRFTVTANGSIEVVDVRASHAAFTQAALEAVHQLSCPEGSYLMPVSFA